MVKVYTLLNATSMKVLTSCSAYLAGTIKSASLKFLKTAVLSDGSIALSFTAFANPDGSLSNKANTRKSNSTAREYETISVRYWDSYYKLERSSLWQAVLTSDFTTKRYSLSNSPPINALRGTGFVFPFTPPNPFIPGGSYDLSPTGLLMTAPNPLYTQIQRTTYDLYYQPLTTFTETSTPSWQKLKVPGFEGSPNRVKFSADGMAAAFCSRKEETEEIWNSLFVIKSIKKPDQITEVRMFEDERKNKIWDKYPASIIWSNDSLKLYITADDDARVRLFSVPLDEILEEYKDCIEVVPTVLIKDGSVLSAHRLGGLGKKDHLLLNRSTIVEPSIFSILDLQTAKSVDILTTFEGGATLGLTSSQVSEIRFKSKEDTYECQAWIVRPSTFQKGKKYPVALIIHGGPEGSTSDSWLPRTNLALFAEHGYIVVAPNPTGSLGFGKSFTDAVHGDWGGRPYDDICSCFDYVKEHLPYADTTRAVAIGPSYVGYMMNRIAGMPLAKQLRTLVCHNGTFSTYGMLGSDMGHLSKRDMKYMPWEDKSNWDRHDPAQFTHNWSTPMLIIHSDKDFRCPITDGLAMYSVCQQKGIPSRFLNFPDENHIVTRPANSLHWYRTVVGWINKYADVIDCIVLQPPVSEPQPHSR